MSDGLTPTMVRDLLAMLREWRAGRLGGRGLTGLQRRQPMPPVSRFGPLFQVTAVDTEAETCSAQRVDAAGEPVEGTDLTGLLYDTAPSVGANVQLCRRSDGSLGVFQGGGGIEIRDDDPAEVDLFDGRHWYNRNA